MRHLVSVVVPIYNTEKYLAETVDSILASTYKDIEVILVNDGSTDGSADICRKYQNADPRVIYIEQENAGVVAARNRAVSIAKGEFILPVDSDDCIAPTYIEKAVAVMREHDNVGIVYCKAEFIGDRHGEWEMPPYTLPQMLWGNVIIEASMFRREDWEKVGGYKPCMESYCEDYDFWLSIIELSRDVHKIQEILVYYRVRNESRTKQLEMDIDKQIKGAKQIYDMHKNLYIENADFIIPRFMEENIILRKKFEFLKSRIPFYGFLKKFRRKKMITGRIER